MCFFCFFMIQCTQTYRHKHVDQFSSYNNSVWTCCKFKWRSHLPRPYNRVSTLFVFLSGFQKTNGDCFLVTNTSIVLQIRYYAYVYSTLTLLSHGYVYTMFYSNSPAQTNMNYLINKTAHSQDQCAYRPLISITFSIQQTKVLHYNYRQIHYQSNYIIEYSYTIKIYKKGKKSY